MRINDFIGRNKIGLVFGAVCLAGIFLVVRPHCWSLVPNAQITYRGQTFIAARLYRSNNDDFILKLNEPGEFIYWLRPDHKRISAANPTNFFFLPSTAFVQHTDQGGVDLADSSDNDFAPRMVVRRDTIEFASRYNGKRIKVSW